MSEEFFIALAEIETRKDGETHYVQPKSPVYGLDEKEVERLTKIKAIRKPTEDEVKLEKLAADSREEGEATKTSRRRGKPADDAI